MNDYAIDEHLDYIRWKEEAMRVRAKEYEDLGWHVVEPIDDHLDIGPWVEANIKGDWRAFAHMWLFENANDATLFKLRWT